VARRTRAKKAARPSGLILDINECVENECSRRPPATAAPRRHHGASAAVRWTVKADMQARLSA